MYDYITVGKTPGGQYSVRSGQFVSRPEHKYIIDSNLFIQWFSNPTVNLELQQFHRVFGPFEYLSAIVVQEPLS